MTGVEPIGPRQLPAGQLTDENVEELCLRLIRLEFPDVRSTETPDGGADALLPSPTGGWARAWQAKRYTNTIHWTKCKESLDRAVSIYGIPRMTFCFARDLTAAQHKAFQSRLAGRHLDVAVDFWDLSELRARLDGSDAGRRIARHYFADSVQNTELVVRAIRAGGQLDTAADAFERALPLGEFLGGHDPFFRYPSTQFEADSQVPLAPGTVLALSNTENGITARLDAVPRDPEVLAKFPPRFRLEFDTPELADAAVTAINEALRTRRPLTIETGVEVTLEHPPPLFAAALGQPSRGILAITPEPPPPWEAIFRARTNRGDASLQIRLGWLAPPPAGEDLAFSGERGGLLATITASRIDGRGRIGVSWRHHLDDAPARDQLELVRFLDVVHGNGKLTIRDALNHYPELVHPLTVEPFPLEPIRAFLESVVAIEDWTGQPIPLPDNATAAETAFVAGVAHSIKRGKVELRWEGSTLPADREALENLVSPVAARIEQELRLAILGQELNLGSAVLDLPAVEQPDLGPVAAGARMHQVEVRPLGGKALHAEWALLPPPSAPSPSVD